MNNASQPTVLLFAGQVIRLLVWAAILGSQRQYKTYLGLCQRYFRTEPASPVSERADESPYSNDGTTTGGDRNQCNALYPVP